MNEFTLRSRKHVSPVLCVLLCFLTALLLCVSASAKVTEQKNGNLWTVTMEVGDLYACKAPPSDGYKVNYYKWEVDHNRAYQLPVNNKSDFYKCFADAPSTWGTDKPSFVLKATGEGTCKLWVRTEYANAPSWTRIYTFEVKADSSATNPEIPVTSVSLDKTALSLNVGESATLTATVLPENATNKTLTWKSSDNSIATVENGVVSAKGVGSTTISTSAGTKTATCTVTVTEAFVPVTSASLDKTALSLKVGESATLTATILPENATNKTLIWRSADNSIATVENGVVTAKGVGSTRILVTAGTKLLMCTVTVTEAEIPVTSIRLDKTTLSLNVGESAALTVTILPENATNKQLTWKSSNSSVASVKDGVVTAIGAGRAMITATLNNSAVVENGAGSTKISFKMVTCVVTVTEAEIPVTSVSLDKTTLSLNVGESAALTATVLPENATNKQLTWRSTNSSVASVKDGVVTAVSTGRAFILVSAGGTTGGTGIFNSGTCVVTVTEAETSQERYLIHGITVQNGSGTIASSIPAGQFQANVSVTKPARTAEAIVILTSYTSDGKFLGIQTEGPGNDTTSSVLFQVDNRSGHIGCLKAFVVDTDFRLLSDVSVFPTQRQY